MRKGIVARKQRLGQENRTPKIEDRTILTAIGTKTA